MRRDNESIQVSLEQVQELLPALGYGYFHQADVAFWGNEEGLGGLPMEAVYERINIFGQDKSAYVNPNDKYSGYWYQSEKNDIDLLRNALNAKRAEAGETRIKEKKINSPMLEFQARLLLHLEEPGKEWFRLKPWYKEHDTEALVRIENCMKHLYTESRQHKAVLIDWRPLPRPIEGLWPYEGIDEKQYISAFKLSKKYLKQIEPVLRGESLTSDDPYVLMLLKRVEMMETVLTHFKFPLLIAAGDAKAKVELLTLILNKYEIQFEQHELVDGKTYHKAVVNLPNRTLTILVTSFFSHYGNCLQLSGLKSLAEKELDILL